MRAIIDKEDISVDDSHVDLEFTKLLAAHPNQEEAKKTVNEEAMKANLKEQLLTEKAFELLEGHAVKNSSSTKAK